MSVQTLDKQFMKTTDTLQGKYKLILPRCAQVSGDWTGTGQVQCYGHVSTDVSTPPGGDYLERGQVTCRPAEWDFDTGLGPEAMLFKPQTSDEFEVWAVRI